jgi:CysZ protein
MLDAAAQALTQMFTPPFRAVLLKSIGLALILIVIMGIGLQHLLSWLAGAGEGYAESTLGPGAHTPLSALAFVLTLVTSLGIIAGSVFLMPAVTALVASFFVDDIALEVERSRYADEPPGQPLPLWRAAIEGIKTALMAVAIYLVALPFLLFAGFGALIFFFCTAYILGREYFELAALRYRPVAQARALRKQHSGTVFVAGMFIAAFVSIPVVNLATPLFGMAFMVHMHKRLAGAQARRIETQHGGTG